MRLLVVASPRSGTRYFAAVLRQAGLDIGHERIGRDGCVSSYFAVDDDAYHGRHQRHGERRRDIFPEQVWHLLRHPLDVIGSLAAAMHRRWWLWQERHTGLGLEIEPYERAARFWLAWTARCQAQAAWTFHVENAQRHWGEIRQRLALPDQPYPALSSEMGNTRGAIRARLTQLNPRTADQIIRRAVHYGYACD